MYQAYFERVEARFDASMTAEELTNSFDARNPLPEWTKTTKSFVLEPCSQEFHCVRSSTLRTCNQSRVAPYFILGVHLEVICEVFG